MTDPIDPRLQYTTLPPRPLSQSYTAGPALGNGQPYYLPTPQPPPSQPTPQSIDPALEQTSPGQEASHDEDDHDDGDHDGYVFVSWHRLAACAAAVAPPHSTVP